MVKLTFNDYGSECNFEVKDNEDHAVEQFMHSNEEHGMDYRKEAVKQFIMRKYHT